MSKDEVPGVGPYGGPAGGWGALQAVARALRQQMGVTREAKMLLKVNQPAGFDCPGNRRSIGRRHPDRATVFERETHRPFA